MTVQDLYNSALALMGNKSDDRFHDFTIAAVNQMYGDLFEINNRIRLDGGLPALETVPTASLFTDTIEYDDRLAKTAMPYGLAARLAMDDGDMARIQWLNNQYYACAQSCRRFVCQKIVDAYALTEDEQ